MFNECFMNSVIIYLNRSSLSIVLFIYIMEHLNRNINDTHPKSDKIQPTNQLTLACACVHTHKVCTFCCECVVTTVSLSPINYVS